MYKYATVSQIAEKIQGAPVGSSVFFGFNQINGSEEATLRAAIEIAQQRHIHLIWHAPGEEEWGKLQKFAGEVEVLRSCVCGSLSDVPKLVNGLSENEYRCIPVSENMLENNTIRDMTTVGVILQIAERQQAKIRFLLEDGKSDALFKGFRHMASICIQGVSSVPEDYASILAYTEKPLSPKLVRELSMSSIKVKTLAVIAPEVCNHESQVLLGQLRDIVPHGTRLLLITEDDKWGYYGATITPEAYQKQQELYSLYVEENDRVPTPYASALDRPFCASFG